MFARRARYIPKKSGASSAPQLSVSCYLESRARSTTNKTSRENSARFFVCLTAP